MSGSGVPYHLRGDVLAVHRAIGHFITTFALVDRSLRTGVAQFFAGKSSNLVGEPHPSTALLSILLDRMTTGRLQSAFLTMSGAIADLDDRDKETRDVLGSMLSHFVKLRNDIAHASWDVGWEDMETGEPVLPTAQVTRVSREGPSNKVLDSMDADTIGREATRLHSLDGVVRLYTHSCLQLRVGDLKERPSETLEIVTIQKPIHRVLVARDDLDSG